MVDKKGEEKEGLKSYIISFIFSSLCSIAIPVALSFYFAPEKSWAYFQNTVQGKADYVASIEWQNILDFIMAIIEEVPPMLQTEYEVMQVIFENVPPALETTATHVLYLDYRITLTLVLAIAIAGYFFPFQETKDWIINVLWGSICVVSGFLPLDEGMDVLSDKDAGMYKMAATLSAVVLTLVANYVFVILGWWLIAKLLSILLHGITSKIFGKKNSKSVVEKKKSIKANNKKMETVAHDVDDGASEPEVAVAAASENETPDERGFAQASSVEPMHTFVDDERGYVQAASADPTQPFDSYMHDPDLSMVS